MPIRKVFTGRFLDPGGLRRACVQKIGMELV